jgi:hypothetical protein
MPDKYQHPPIPFQLYVTQIHHPIPSHSPQQTMQQTPPLSDSTTLQLIATPNEANHLQGQHRSAFILAFHELKQT